MSMTREEAIELLRDTPIDIRSTREDDIHTLYATAQMMAISALRPVSRERVEQVWIGGWIAVTESELTGFNPKLAGCDPIGGYRCSRCNEEAVLDCNDEFVLDNFCPRCGAAMTDEAVDMMMERLEALKDGKDD